MPNNSSPLKIAATASYGASITFSGPTSPEREAALAHILTTTAARFIPPYNHAHIILGAGTAALELLSQLPPHLDHLHGIITPVGGGGLLSGTALTCSTTPTLVFGAEPTLSGTDDCTRAFRSGVHIPAVPASATIADGLRTPVGLLPWSIIHTRKLVHSVYSVSEAEIKAALRLVWERMKVVVEPRYVHVTPILLRPVHVLSSSFFLAT